MKLHQTGMEEGGDSWTIPLPWAIVRDKKTVQEGTHIMVEKDEEFVVNEVGLLLPAHCRDISKIYEYESLVIPHRVKSNIFLAITNIIFSFLKKGIRVLFYISLLTNLALLFLLLMVIRLMKREIISLLHGDGPSLVTWCMKQKACYKQSEERARIRTQ